MPRSAGPAATVTSLSIFPSERAIRAMQDQEQKSTLDIEGFIISVNNTSFPELYFPELIFRISLYFVSEFYVIKGEKKPKTSKAITY